MNWERFLKDFLLSKVERKFHQVAITIFIGTMLGALPSLDGIVGVTLFFLAYLSTYFYNDLLDYEKDRKRATYAEKILARGHATPREFIVLLGNISVLSVFLATLWDPLLGLYTVLAILLNNLRTHIEGTLARQILLILVELMNFEAFWVSFFGSPVPALFIPLFITYSAIYALGHAVYKEKAEVKDIVRNEKLRNLAVLTVIGAIVSLPVLMLSLVHFLLLLFGLLLYIVPMMYTVSRVGVKDERGIDIVHRRHRLLLLIIGIVLVGGSILYVYMDLPFRVELPEEYRMISSYFDSLQNYIIDRLLGKAQGIR